MLCRNKYGALSLSLSSSLFKIFTPPLLSPPVSSNITVNFTYPNHVYTNFHGFTNMPISFTTQFRYVYNDPSTQTLQNLDSDVNSVSSLLSNQTLLSTSIDDLLKDYKYKLSSSLVEQVLLNYKQFGRIRTLEFFSWAGLQMGFRFDDCVVEYVADFLGRRKLFDDLKCLLVTVSAYKGNVSCRTFSTCIRFLGRQGRVREALSLFKEMESEFKCKPDNLVINNMLYVLCKKENSGDLIDVAFDIFRRIESPDTYSYSNILVGLCKFGRLKTAVDVFLEMDRDKLIPTRSAVNVLIGELCSLSAKEGAIEKVRVNNVRRPFTILVPNVCSKSGAIQPAITIFWAVNNMGLLPSAFVVNQLVLEVCRLGNMEEAVRILKAVEDRKLSCLQEIYSIVIHGLCEHRLVEEACNLFWRMLSKGLKPKLVVYNSVICMLCKLGSLDDAKKVFEIMNKNRCLPDSVTYTALIHAYGGARNWESSYELLKEMLGLGWCPHFHTYSLVDKLLRENDRMDLSVKLEGKLEMQILQKHLKEDRLEAAYEKLKSMLEKGISPPIYVRDAFAQSFRKSGKWDIARELLERMDVGHKLGRQTEFKS